jgi:hypothetical protein
MSSVFERRRGGIPLLQLLSTTIRVTKEETVLQRRIDMKKVLAKWLVSVIILPAVMIALRKRINEFIDEHL